MPIVIDPNIAIAWFLPTPANAARAALAATLTQGAIVPPLWRREVQDVLRRLHSAGRLSQTVDYVRDELRQLPITVDDELTTLFGNEARVAARYKVTLYDAAYLELALRLGIALATTDRALAAAAEAAKTL